MSTNKWFSSTVAACLVIATVLPQSSRGVQPIVEVEDEVYRYTPADNGAGPMWCNGSTCLVRIGEEVFASGIETLDGAPPLNNCRWLLYGRRADGWHLEQADERGRTREPCPLAAFADGRLLLSVNPTLAGTDAYSGPARPEILQFDAGDPTAAYKTILPAWSGAQSFSEHSYRSFAADGPRRELILLQNVGYTHAAWAFCDAGGQWRAGELRWPWGAEYDEPQPIRVCYPNVMLRDRAMHFCGVSDIQEPCRAWRDYKKQVTGRDWDYDFRRLFYTWTDDIASGKFHDWVEVASRDKTGGRIMPGDLWVGPDGRVHVLWTEQAIDERLREKFFPDARQSYALNYAVLQDGAVLMRRTLVLAEEGVPGETASAARFHVTPENRLYVVCYVSGTSASGQPVSQNRLMELLEDGAPGETVVLPLSQPLASFFTATVRAGSPLSQTLDMLGTPAKGAEVIRYARVRLKDYRAAAHIHFGGGGRARRVDGAAPAA